MAKYYLIDKKYNCVNIIKISECKKYKGKILELKCIYDFFTINLNDNYKFVYRIFQISP